MTADTTTTEIMATFAKQFAEMAFAEFRKLMSHEQLKEWYTTEELATALGKSPLTIREKWCNQKRIDAEKDVDSNKWLIPGTEYKRLVLDGGRPLALKDVPKPKKEQI